ncbi:hypothetical protein EauS123_00023 [Exiguobacterium phage vB_EauS-123]|nr:hypothetical protein EauS123_00023 [Exiguobacterium phage vB_EauS-123]
MPSKDEMLKAQHVAIEKLQKEKQDQANEFGIMQMQNYEYRTMILQLLQVLETIDEADDLLDYEYSRFVQVKVSETLNQYGHASTFVHQTDPEPLEETRDKHDD